MMMKFMFIGRRAAGRTRRAALDHLRDIHAKMVVCPPSDAGSMPRDYVQNHVLDGAYPASGEHALERDLVTEFWFDSVDQMRAAIGTPYYLANLKPDEPRFVDDTSVAKMMVQQRMLRAGATNRFKAFLFVSAHAGDARAAGLAAGAAAFQGSPGLTAAVENLVMPPPTGGRPFVDLVLEGWFSTREAAAAVVDRLGAALDSFGSDCIDPERSFAVLAEQFDTDRLRAFHGCPAAT